jgi:hypothetical protein
MLKNLRSEFYLRVVVSHRSTLTFLGLAILVFLVDFATGILSSVHWSLAPAVMGVLVILGGSLKNKEAVAAHLAEQELAAAITPKPPAAAGYATAWVLLGLVIAVLLILATPFRSRADDSAPGASAPTLSLPAAFTLKLPAGWTLHPGITFGPAVGREWNLSAKTAKWTNNVSLGGLAVLDYKAVVGVILGLAGNVTVDGKLSGAIDGGVLGPPILVTTVPLRPGIIAQYSEAGAQRTLGVYAALHATF